MNKIDIEFHDDEFDIPTDPWADEDTMSNKVRKKVNGKRKGNAYERDVANDLSKRFNDVFRRVPQSGAFMGGVNRFKNKNLRKDAQEILAGDIICPKWFPFVIEAKNYKDTPKIHNLFSRGDADLDKWIAQSKGESEVAEKPWMITFKVTSIRGKQFIVIDGALFKEKMGESLDAPCQYMLYKGTVIIDYKIFYEKCFSKFDDRICEDNDEEVVESKSLDGVDIKNLIGE